ncbi:MAG: NAD(P)/FAD-dependent oxidoreductase [Anaerolineaceae bacterium]|nr:NAD(P)/FAD-dependent oxidoreductase [Anaerolineaceae bacterium]
MRIAIIGAGVGGMAAAYDLHRAGHEIIVFEAAKSVGGLAAGFKDPHWDWSVEQYYHHWFTSDSDILGLIKELGLYEKVVFPHPKTVSYFKGKFYPLDSPLAAITFPGFSFLDMIRFGLVTAYLRYIAAWQPLEKFTADEWIQRYYGKNLYNVLFQPMLEGKFGPHQKEVNMAWFWARFKTRTTVLGTYQGGFQAFADDFAAFLQNQGVKINLETPVQQINPCPGGILELVVNGQTWPFDRCLVTVSPALLARMAPALPDSYLRGLLNLKSMGAVVMILALRNQLSQEGYYWYTLPKSAGFPFLALVEHTNFLKPEFFGGDHIIYCGDYLDAGHENFSLSKEELQARILPSLTRFNPEFRPDWVRESWLFKTNYAQPIPLVNHSHNVPDLRTPIAGLFFASMSQVYPWDRGTNFAVQIARRAAQRILEDK